MPTIFTPGATLVERALPPLTVEDLAAYAVASGDYNPLHTDPATAYAAGFPLIIAHGMLVMGILSRMAVELAGPTGMRDFSVRFRAPTLPGEPLRCGARVAGVEPTPAGDLIVLDIWVANAAGEQKAGGTCTFLQPNEA